MDLAWPWVLAVAVGWLLLELVARRRAVDAPPAGRWLSRRARRHWPLAAILALPGVLGSLDATATMALLGFVLLLWVVAPDGGGDRCLTDPLLAIGRSLRGLRRSPWLVALLIVGLGIAAGRSQLRSARWQGTHPEGSARTEGAPRMAPRGVVGWSYGLESETETAWSCLRDTFESQRSSYVPTPKPPYLGTPLLAGAPLALLVALIALRARRADWLSEERRARMVWPIQLLLADLALWVALRALAQKGPIVPPGDLHLLRGQLLLGAHLLAHTALYSFTAAPVAAAAYRVLLQIGAGRGWNLREAVESAIDSWLPIALAMLLLGLTGGMGIGGIVKTLWPSVTGDARHTPYWLTALDVPLGLAFALVPWAIVGGRVGLRRALAWTYRAAVAVGPALVVWAVRYTALLMPVFALLNLLSFGLHAAGHDPLPLLGVAIVPAVELLMLLALAGLYADLRQEVGEPLANGALRVRSVTPEEPSDDPVS